MTNVAEMVRPALGGRILVLTGAGISAESGIPTYRGDGGLWRTMNFEERATFRAFRADPERIWTWYRERRRAVAEAAPNGAHVIVADLVAAASDGLIVTQNVDDLHDRVSAQRLVHIHGEILKTGCTECDYSVGARPDDGPEACPACKEGTLRPGVVWFDEDFKPDAERQVLNFLEASECSLVLVIGTSASFDYIREWIVRAAGTKAIVVDVNPAESGIVPLLPEGRVLHLRERAVAALQGLWPGVSVDGGPTL